MSDLGIKLVGKDTLGNAKAIKTDNDGVLGVYISGNSLKDAPITAIKGVTSTPTEIFSGTSAKQKRRKLILKNEDAILRFRVGENKTTLQQTGFPVEPGATVEFEFENGTQVPIYVVSEGAIINIAIMEV